MKKYIQNKQVPCEYARKWFLNYEGKNKLRAIIDGFVETVETMDEKGAFKEIRVITDLDRLRANLEFFTEIILNERHT